MSRQNRRNFRDRPAWVSMPSGPDRQKMKDQDAPAVDEQRAKHQAEMSVTDERLAEYRRRDAELTAAIQHEFAEMRKLIDEPI